MIDPVTVYIVLRITSWQHLDVAPEARWAFPELKIRGDGRIDNPSIGVAFAPVYRDKEAALHDYPGARVLEAQVPRAALEKA